MLAGLARMWNSIIYDIEQKKCKYTLLKWITSVGIEAKLATGHFNKEPSYWTSGIYDDYTVAVEDLICRMNPEISVASASRSW